jgi:hypothetical protein
MTGSGMGISRNALTGGTHSRQAGFAGKAGLCSGQTKQ